MTEHQKETAFLRRIILFDDTEQRHKLEESIAQVQRDQRCVQRGTSLMALFAVLSLAGLAYAALFQENFPFGESQLVIKIIGEIGLAALISLAGFSGLSIAYRRKLKRLREQCRRLVTKLLESRLGKPHITPLGDGPLRADNRQVAQSAVEINGAPDRLDSLRGCAL